MTNYPAPEAHSVAPFAACPLPKSVEHGEPVFMTDAAMKSLSVDTYFLTLHTPSEQQSANPNDGTWYDEWKITLKIDRQSKPAYGRIVEWLQLNLSGWSLLQWEYDDPDKAAYRGVIGLMGMRVA